MSEAERNVCEMKGDHRVVADLDIRSRTLARLDTIEKIFNVIEVHVFAAGAAMWLARHAVRFLSLLHFGFGENLPPAAIEDEHTVIAMKCDAMIAHIRPLADSRRVLPDHAEAVELPQRLLRIRRLFGIVGKSEFAPDRHCRARRFYAHPPVGDVDHMRAPIGHESAGIIVIPAEVEMKTIAVKGAFGR